jgi:hypothetical protein
LKGTLEAKSGVLLLYHAMQDLLGGEWNDDTHDWGPCDMPDGKEGVSYALFSQRAYQPLPTGSRKLAEQAQEIWARLGHPVEMQHDDVMMPLRHILSDPRWLAGSKPDGSLFQFTIGEDYADFTARSRCVLGDQEQLNLLEE